MPHGLWLAMAYAFASSGGHQRSPAKCALAKTEVPVTKTARRLLARDTAGGVHR